MPAKSILLLTAGFGEGHNAAARNLQEAIASATPETPCAVNDVLRDAYGRLTRIVENGYITIINHFPSLWKAAFKILDRTRARRTAHQLVWSCGSLPRAAHCRTPTFSYRLHISGL